jgi:fructokinase
MRIGIDLGGTKIEIVALDAQGEAVVRRRVPTPAGDYERILDTLVQLVDGVERDLQERASVGIATPGVTSPATGLMKNANSTVLIGKPFALDASARLGRDVLVANDANCFALSEAVDGAAAGLSCVFGVILGTGVGGGIALGGRPLEGCNGIAGEWGHNPLPWPSADELPGPACYCGKRGCIETFLSGPALAADHARHGGAERDVPAIVRAAAAGEARAAASLERYTDRLARGLATVVNVLDPDAVVLGGGLSNVASLYEELPARLAAYVFSDSVATPVRRALHGDSSGVRGAAWLWPAAVAPGWTGG